MATRLRGRTRAPDALLDVATTEAAREADPRLLAASRTQRGQPVAPVIDAQAGDARAEKLLRLPPHLPGLHPGRQSRPRRDLLRRRNWQHVSLGSVPAWTARLAPRQVSARRLHDAARTSP